jgi:Flp pilus assembly pilin Flp
MEVRVRGGRPRGAAAPRVRREHGVTSIEYALLAALIGMTLVGALGLMGTRLDGVFATLSNCIGGVTCNASADSGGGSPGGGNPNPGGGNPNPGGGNPNPGGGNPNPGGGNPNPGGGNPNPGGGNPNPGCGNPNPGGGNPPRGGN